MRIAASGAHFTGKTTLITDLAEQLPGYDLVEEPYYILEERGYQFAELPSVEDFERQLLLSLRLIKESHENTLFDRSPVDFIAYALCMENTVSFDLNSWLSRAVEGLAMLDLILFTPIDSRISVPGSENSKLRHDVEEKLNDVLIYDCFGLDLAVLEVTGSRKERVDKVLKCISVPGRK
ncbi:MAG TPA: AAA family ATPase [Chitinophagaceae bacterium]|nr:AAA family ATPase [Chitinophagaceae bacterium]